MAGEIVLLVVVARADRQEGQAGVRLVLASLVSDALVNLAKSGSGILISHPAEKRPVVLALMRDGPRRRARLMKAYPHCRGEWRAAARTFHVEDPVPADHSFRVPNRGTLTQAFGGSAARSSPSKARESDVEAVRRAIR